MTLTLLVKNGRVVNPAKKQDELCDIYIEDGIIRAMGPHLSLQADDTLDASGLTVTPGLIDMHVHLRQPGQSGKETLDSGTAAAAAVPLSRVSLPDCPGWRKCTCMSINPGVTVNPEASNVSSACRDKCGPIARMIPSSI